MSDLVQEANALFVDEEYEAALEKFDEAVNQDPKNAEIYTKRSNCHFKLEDFVRMFFYKNDLNYLTGSIQDASLAIEYGNRTNQNAFFRRGMAAFSLGEYESALESFKIAEQLKPSTAGNMWIRKCQAELAESEFQWN